MNIELLRLQDEVRELRQQNFEHQKNIKYIPLNITSNNLYINNSLNKSSINSNSSKNNNLFSSLISGREIKKKKLGQKKRIPFGKLPLKRGMFSYKTSLNNNNIPNTNYNYNDLIRSQSQNIIEVNEPNFSNNININKYNNNNSLLSAELKLNLDDNYGERDFNIDQNKSMGNKVLSSSSLDLNKYKINKNNITNQKKNILISNNQRMNYSNRALNITPYNFQNNTYKSYNFLMNQNQLEKINPDSIENKNNLSMIVGNKKKKIRKIADHFKKNPKNEKESRRMIIELIKILNKKEYKNKKIYTYEDIENVLEKNNISKKVLNKEYSKEELNSINNQILENNKIINDINNSNINSRRNLLTNSIESNSNSPNYKDIKNNTNSIQKSLFTPIKKNINNFLLKMNDVKKDKIKLINFLSIPRIMHLYFMNQKYTYIFVLCPNIICYNEGIESYIFKFADMITKKYVGGFDLIKVKICSKIQNKPNYFYIETFDGKTNRNYIFETISENIAGNYVKAINYLSQLVKCKIYDYKSIYKK